MYAAILVSTPFNVKDVLGSSVLRLAGRPLFIDVLRSSEHCAKTKRLSICKEVNVLSIAEVSETAWKLPP